jgi:hypothetical protein
VNRELRELIFRMVDENSTWGAARIHGELKMLGFNISERSVLRWMSGNVTEAGVIADLEWMHRMGIGGFQMFDGDIGAPLFVDKPLIWRRPEWKSAWRNAAAEADRLHMEMGLAASGCCSETAGPWVKPSQGMERFVWSETAVTVHCSSIERNSCSRQRG